MTSVILGSGTAPQREPPEVPDSPIDFSVPYRSRERGAARHFGFFPFFAKKPWPVVQEYITHYTQVGDLVCDPFSGSGVTAVEALILGRRAVASDINPVARFITRMTAVSPVDLHLLRQSYQQVRAVAEAPIKALDSMTDTQVLDMLSTFDYPRTPIPRTVRRAGADTVDELHTSRQLAGLTILRNAISEAGNPQLRDLLRVALANTVRYTNRMYAGRAGTTGSQYRGNANFLRRFSYSLASNSLFYEHHVWQTFERTFKGVIDAKEETNRLIGSRYNDANFILADVPASRIHEITGEGMVDYCFTDPPYSNDIYFLDLSSIWAAWLGMEITDQARKAELLIGGTQGKSRELFEREFAASIESIARALKEDRWFTLVYKHRDLSLWQTIVAICERYGLRYLNAVWQNVKIRSTRQIESPNINPKGDMYLNFRKMSPRRFEAVYGSAPVLTLPTRANYVEHEVERIIVSYLGADIELITSSVIQQILDSRSFQRYQESPQVITEDLQKVLLRPRFTTWDIAQGRAHWVMTPETSLDPSLEPVDRVRYYLFELLRQRGEATEGEIMQALLTRFSQAPGSETINPGIVPSLLRSIGREVSPRSWRFDPARVADYKQLRLLFRPSRADEIRDGIERRHPEQQAVLRLDLEGIALLRDRLRSANGGNPRFEAQYHALMEILQTVLWRLNSHFGDAIERVMAVGDWAREGIDLRNLPYDDLIIQVVFRGADRPYALYENVAEKVFADLRDDEFLVQFQLETLPEWQHARSRAEADSRGEALGTALLVRA